MLTFLVAPQLQRATQEKLRCVLYISHNLHNTSSSATGGHIENL